MPIVVDLSTYMQQVPVRHLTLRGHFQGECADCHCPMVEHYATNTLTYLGCPLHRPEAIPVNALTVLVEWFGADGTQNLIDFIEIAGVTELRRQLALLLAVKGGR